MTNTYKAYKSLKKQTTIFLSALSLLILFFVTATKVTAQAGYTDIYSYPYTQNWLPYQWQNVNLSPGSYNYQMYTMPQSIGWNQVTPGYASNYLTGSYGSLNYLTGNYGYGFQNYQNMGMTYGNYAYMSPMNFNTFGITPMNYYQGLNYTYPTYAMPNYSTMMGQNLYGFTPTNYYQGLNYTYPAYGLPNYSTMMGQNPYFPFTPFTYQPGGPRPSPEIIQPADPISEYLAIVPRVLHIGSDETVSVSLFRGGGLSRKKAMGNQVRVTLSKDGEEILEAGNYIQDKGIIEFVVPEVPEGSYELKIKGETFEDAATVSVVKDLLLFLQTDKPIYQPGQTIHMRLISLNSELKPRSREAMIQVQDAKGIKIFRKEVVTDVYGMATLDLPISTEPNLGVWKITAASGPATIQLDVRVEKYVLPKYEVKVDLPREWFLVDEPVVGKVKAEYSFGKPVKGNLVITVSRYVGEWEVYETLTKTIDGEAEFEISPVGYVAGVPAAGGKGNVTLDVVVTEQNTGYEEKTNRLITISDSATILQVIPESSVFKPSLPFNLLIVSKTPDYQPCEVTVTIDVTYINSNLEPMGTQQEVVATQGGKALLTLTPPAGCVAFTIEAEGGGGQVSRAIESSYSPSGNFIHVEQISPGIPKVGEEIRFKLHSTNEAVHFYFEVISRDKVIFSDFTDSDVIGLVVTPMMAPQARLLVYQILPNSEVAADYLPFNAEANYPLNVEATFSKEEEKPGEEISIIIETGEKAKVGLAAVDRSVFILAENRLNLQQVFEELERLYMEPQVELHATSVYSEVCTKGARDIFDEAGMIVLSNQNIPDGKEYTKPKVIGWPVFWGIRGGGWGFNAFDGNGAMMFAAFGPDFAPEANSGQTLTPETQGLAEVEKIRQFFPETWLWEELETDDQGHGSITATVPDTITTWQLQAVALSRENGLGISEDSLKAFQSFFITIDLPYSAIRGEEFPVRISVYNYLDESQNVLLEIENADWFSLLDNSYKTVAVEANDLGGAQFMIRPTQLGVKEIKITARSSGAADAVMKTIHIIPEGVERDYAESIVLNSGDTKTFHTFMPGSMVEGSGRAYIAATGSYLTQSIEGLDGLLKMPCGCGEQNMIYLAPDIYVTRYLKETGQLKPEIMAKAENLMITGYQRELTYRRDDGSFSAFGNQDNIGSLWLTAFVLKVFSQGRDLMYIDPDILSEAKNWILSHQKADGSFESVGFVHHGEMIGGVSGKNALTAFTAIALMEAGGGTSALNAITYLEDRLAEIDDAYTMAIVAHALELANSSKKTEAYEKLMGFAQDSENGLYWPASGAEIEASAYALLALMEHGDLIKAGRTAQWLVTKRNAFGGFGSTQDTVVALEALTAYSEFTSSNVDMTIRIDMGEGSTQQILVNSENFDVLQTVELPINTQIEISATGQGKAVIQLVKRYNLPEAQPGGQIFDITVDYDAAQVAVNDIVTVSASVEFNPFMPVVAEMVVLDISVPTGFAAVADSLEMVLEGNEKIKRYEMAGRKVIFYIEGMIPDECIAFTFEVKAMYPVKAKGTSSQAYSYYDPTMKGETLSQDMEVSGQ